VKNKDKLDQPQELFVTLAEESPNMIFINKDGKIVYANEKCEELMGYTKEEFYAEDFDFMKLITPESKDLVLKNFIKHMRGEELPPYDYNLLTKDGQEIVAIHTTKLIEYKGGKAILGIITDVTERKKIEEALKNSRQFLQTIYDAIPDAVIVTDTNFNVTSCNKSVEKILGYAPNELLGEPYSIFLAQEMFASSEQINRREELFEKGYLISKDFCFKRKNGEKFPGSFSVAVIRNDQGEFVGLVGAIHETTQQKKAEEAYRESEKRYRGLFEDSPISLWEEDFSEVKRHIDYLRSLGVKNFRRYFNSHPEDVARCARMVRVVDVNKATLNLYGASSKMEFRQGLEDVFTAEAFTTFKEELISIAGGKTSFESETVNKPLTGDKLNINLKWSVAPGYEETLSKVFVSIIDITESKKANTERKRAEEALRESEQRYRQIIETAGEGIWLIDAEGITTYANPRMAEMLGYAVEEMTGHSFYEFMDTKAKAEAEGYFERRRLGIKEEHDFRFQRKDGSDLWTLLATSPVFDDEQNFLGALGMVTDITERKKMEEALIESELNFRGMAERSFDPLFILSVDGTAKYVAPSLKRVLGYSPEEVVGKNFTEFIPESDVPKILKKFSEVQKGSPAEAMEAQIMAKDGTKIIAEVNASPVMRDGEIIEIQGVFRDITQRKKAEEELKRAYEELKETQEELIQTAKMGAIGQLAAGISHELNQPLTGIKGFAQAALWELKNNNPLKEDLERIVEQTNRMSRIIQNIHRFSRKATFEMKNLSINKVVEDALMLLNKQLQVRGIKLEKSLAEDLPPVKGDANQLQQVFINILANARDSIEKCESKSARSIRVRTGLNKNNSHIQIIFKDNGCGISKENQKRIFDPFFSTKSPEEGVGLGLSIVKRIIDAHKGRVGVESEEGKGATFIIKLPLPNDW